MKKIIEELKKITDTRRQWGNIRHKLVDIVFIGLVSVICGGTDFEHMEDTGYGKYDWLKKYLELPHGIPELLDILDIEGSTVTIDAMGCQKQIAAKVCEKKADYLLGLKGNQPALLADVRLYFENETSPHTGKSLEKDHGRIEQREYYLETEIEWLAQRKDWAGLNGIGMVKTSVISQKTGEFTEECRYFLTSLTNIGRFADAVRKHWSIENQLHWQLDVTFEEDGSRARKDNSPLKVVSR